MIESLNELSDDLFGFSKIGNPLESGVKELFFNSWRNDAVSGETGDESESWVLGDKVDSSTVLEVEVIGHTNEDTGKEWIVSMVVEADCVEGHVGL